MQAAGRPVHAPPVEARHGHRPPRAGLRHAGHCRAWPVARRAICRTVCASPLYRRWRARCGAVAEEGEEVMKFQVMRCDRPDWDGQLFMKCVTDDGGLISRRFSPEELATEGLVNG